MEYAMDKKTLKMLILEDNPDDAELEVRELKKAGFDIDWKRVETEKDFKKALKEKPDIILADYKLPSFDGMSAIKIQQKTTPDIPLIIISGTIGEEIAIECLKAGATDYVLKDKLSRLSPVVKRALKEAEEHRERKKAEKALRKSEEQFRLIAENTSDNIAITTFDLKATYLYLSPSLKSMIGFDPEELLGKSFFDFIHPEDKKILLPLLKKYVNHKIKKLLSGKESTVNEKIEYRFINKDRKWRNFQSTINIVGKQLLAVTRDITERKQAEEALRESEEKYRRLFEKSKDAILIIHNGKFVDCNQATINMLRYKNKDEILNTHPSELSPEKQPDGKMSLKKANEMMRIAYENGSHRFEWDHKKSDGEVFPVEVLLTTISSEENNQILHTVWRDITERKQAEKIQKTLFNISNALNTVDNLHELLIKIREYLGKVIDTTNFYVALYDEKTDSISLPFGVNEKDKFETFPAGKTITKYVIKTGKPLLATKDVVRKLIKKGLIETVGAPSEIWLGVPLKIENKVIGVIAVQSYDDPNLYTEKDIEILTFISEEIALAINRKQAEENLEKAHEELKELHEDLQKKVDKTVNELREKDHLLIQQSRLAAMGEMIGNIAHQWRQPLTAVSAVVQDIGEAYKYEELNEEYLHNAIKTTMEQIIYMSHTIDDFRNFFMPNKEREVFYINEAVKSTVRFIESSFKHNEITLELDMQEECEVKGFSNEYTQVILNILNNAKDAIKKTRPENPKVKLKLKKLEKGKYTTSLTISNNAERIPEDIINKIFDPYFTTKYESEGTGLGLYMSKTIIEKNMNGRITAKNLENGVQFKIEV